MLRLCCTFIRVLTRLPSVLIGGFLFRCLFFSGFFWCFFLFCFLSSCFLLSSCSFSTAECCAVSMGQVLNAFAVESLELSVSALFSVVFLCYCFCCVIVLYLVSFFVLFFYSISQLFFDVFPVSRFLERLRLRGRFL